MVADAGTGDDGQCRIYAYATTSGCIGYYNIIMDIKQILVYYTRFRPPDHVDAVNVLCHVQQCCIKRVNVLCFFFRLSLWIFLD